MVHILLFANLAQEAGTQKIEIEMDLPASVEQVRKKFKEEIGHLKGIDHCLIAVNEEYAEEMDIVKAGDTIAFIPPVSGG
ncbi:molybdopterin converting factor subunit 1 [Fictibacillus nanhaiensis]|uniref:molybdopterin converting factor subunit 1 n=1 Tax=Fictibacillus nanhaiensis TaxID=742169 RepID=UPI001C952B4A|nr:molybdopterin converting factor subunit 1 [Fictibacillus nanhaiensis]MBY6036345.1 molybdopterin converting factor subunit 1 [Fictibacillus nanhaiensis]